MKSFVARYINTILWSIAAIGMATIIILLFTLNLKTDRNVEQIKNDLQALQKNIERDHDGQDKLLTCLVDMFIESDAAMRPQVDRCVASSATSGTSEGTAPADPVDTSVLVPVETSSFPDTTAAEPPEQSENSQQEPEGAQPPETQPVESTPPPDEPASPVERIITVIRGVL